MLSSTAFSDARLPLIGRDLELDRARAALDDVLAGQRRTVLVSGEPGIGKTRLVQELAAIAESQGALVAWGRVDDVDGAPPYWPWLQVLDAVLEHTDRGTLTAALGGDADAISMIVPAVAQLVDVAPPPPLDPAAARFRLHQAVTGFLGRVSAQRPLVIVLDDMHWADVSSLELIRFAAAAQVTGALLLVLTYRTVDAGDTALLDEVLASLARRSALERIGLVGLSEAEVGRFMAQEIGLRPRHSAVSSVYTRTAGNPFFVAELARLLQSEGLREAADGDQLDVVPESVRDVIRRRLGRLPSQTRDVLVLGAVLGRGFELSTLAACCGCSELDAADLVEPALAAGLLRAGIGGARMQFSHALVRETIYGGLSALRRATLHARVGSAIEQRSDAGSSHVAELAVHFAHAAPVLGPDRGIGYALQAAGAAESSLAYERAEDDLRRALRLIAMLDDGNDRAQRELEVQNRLFVLLTSTQGMAAPAVGRVSARARELCEQIGESDGLFHALCNLCSFHIVRGDVGMTARFAGELLVIGRQRDDPMWLRSGHALLGVAQSYAGQLALARASFTSMRALVDGAELLIDPAEASSSVHAVVTALLHDARCAWLMGDEAHAQALGQEAFAAATRLAIPHTFAFACYQVTQLHILAGDAASARTLSERGIAYCDEHGLPGVRAWCRILRGWAISELGRPGDAVADMTDAVARSRAARSRINIPLFNALLADVHARRGDVAAALELIEDALAESRENQVWVSDLHRRRAELFMTGGVEHRAAAADELRTAIAVAESQGAVTFARRAAAALARIQPRAAAIEQASSANLSPRERELLSLVGRGLTDKQIADELVISLATVRSHLDRIRDKTGRRRRPELTRLAVELGLPAG